MATVEGQGNKLWNLDLGKVEGGLKKSSDSLTGDEDGRKQGSFAHKLLHTEGDAGDAGAGTIKGGKAGKGAGKGAKGAKGGAEAKQKGKGKKGKKGDAVSPSASPGDST